MFLSVRQFATQSPFLPLGAAQILSIPATIPVCRGRTVPEPVSWLAFSPKRASTLRTSNFLECA